MFFSPNIYALVLVAPMVLLLAPNPLGWGDQFQLSEGLRWDIAAAYVLSFMFFSLFKLKILGKENDAKISFSPQLFWVALAVVSSFQIAKFVNIGDIPLFGDPLSRYRLTIGGYADFPTRMLPPLSWISLLLYVRLKRLRYLIGAVIPVFLTLLLMQRQETIYCIMGFIIIFFIRRKLSLRQVMAVGLMVVLALYFLGYGAVMRYGAENLSSSIPASLLPIWIVHAEFSVPTRLAHMVIESMGGDMLYGRYTFASFYDLLSKDALTGAEYIREHYTEAQTAQSISAPFSYYLDFALFGVIAIAGVTAIIMKSLYRVAKDSQGDLSRVLYALVFLSALLSVRSGTSILNILLIYTVLFAISLTTGGSGLFRPFRQISRVLIIVSMPISISTLIYKI